MSENEIKRDYVEMLCTIGVATLVEQSTSLVTDWLLVLMMT
jgi:hypothetical protein